MLPGEAKLWVKRNGLNAVLLALAVILLADVVSSRNGSSLLRAVGDEPSSVPAPSNAGAPAEMHTADPVGGGVPASTPQPAQQEGGVPPPSPSPEPAAPAPSKPAEPAEPQPADKVQAPPPPEQPTPAEKPPTPKPVPAAPPAAPAAAAPAPPAVETFKGGDGEVPAPLPAPAPEAVYWQFVGAADRYVRTVDSGMDFAVTRCEKPGVPRAETLPDKVVGNACEPWYTRGAVEVAASMLHPSSSKVLVFGDETAAAWWLARAHTVVHIAHEAAHIRDQVVPNVVAKLAPEVKARYRGFAIPPVDATPDTVRLYLGYRNDKNSPTNDFTRMCRAEGALTDQDKRTFDVVVTNSRARVGTLWEAVHTWAKPSGALIVLNNSGRNRYRDAFPKFVPGHWLAFHDTQAPEAGKMTSLWVTCAASEEPCKKAREELAKVTAKHPEMLDASKKFPSWQSMPNDELWPVNVDELYQKTGAQKPQ